MVASKNGLKGADRGTGTVYGAKLTAPTGLGVVVAVPDDNWEGIIVLENFPCWVVLWKVN